MERIDTPPKLPPRGPGAHKGDFGRVCVVAGSLGMSGAAALVGRSALRSGAGLVRVATPRDVLPIVASIEPAYTTIPLPQDEQARVSAEAIGPLLDAAEDNDILAIGPGLGVSTQIKAVLEILIKQAQLRIVLDADGLNNLATLKGWHAIAEARLILTPHPGEMRRLWASVFRRPLPENREEQAASLAVETHAVVVLKGAGTVVTDGRSLYVNRTGNPAMATAGTGDVLTGVITALAGQGLNDLDAAILGVYIHGLAGDIAAEQLGPVSVMATDIIEALPRAFQKQQQM